MARKTNTKVVELRPDIAVAPKVKTTAYNDINLNAWKEYDYVKTDTLWEIPSRLKEGGHSNEYHGNFIPQIAQQLYWRYTKENDVVLDLFFVLKSRYDSLEESKVPVGFKLFKIFELYKSSIVLVFGIEMLYIFFL